MNCMDTRCYDELSSVIQALTRTVGEITALEREKTKAASLSEHKLLEQCIQKEQASILKLRGQEQKRLKLMKEMDCSGLTFKQLLEVMPEEQKPAFSPLFLVLEQSLDQLTQARQAAERIINVRLHSLQTALSQAQGLSYDKNGTFAPSSVHIKNKYV